MVVVVTVVIEAQVESPLVMRLRFWCLLYFLVRGLSGGSLCHVFSSRGSVLQNKLSFRRFFLVFLQEAGRYTSALVQPEVTCLICGALLTRKVRYN